MEYTKAHNIPGILVSLDFRKAFDSQEWPFIMRTLDAFNFGTSIKKWVCTFYTNIESAALNNGFLTKWFRPSTGVRQGCPLSPYLFILSAEIMANKLRQDPSIKGIEILGNELKLSQYADDTNLLCADLASVENSLEVPYLPVYKSTFYSLKIGPKNRPRLIHGSKTEIKRWSEQISITIVAYVN